MTKDQLKMRTKLRRQRARKDADVLDFLTVGELRLRVGSFRHYKELSRVQTRHLAALCELGRRLAPLFNQATAIRARRFTEARTNRHNALKAAREAQEAAAQIPLKLPEPVEVKR